MHKVERTIHKFCTGGREDFGQEATYYVNNWDEIVVLCSYTKEKGV